MNLHRALRHCLIFGLASLPSSQGSDSQILPWPIPYNDSRSFGPDGPWNVLSMSTGWAPEQYVDFYPGGSGTALFITPQVCEQLAVTCPKPLPQFYAKSQDPGQHDNATSHQSVAAEAWDPDRTEALALTGTGRNIVARMTVHSIPYFIADNCSVFMSQNLTSNYPNGLQLPLTVGMFPLGAASDNETVVNDDGVSSTANYLLGLAFLNRLIPSRSWGLHIGSAAQNISGSLYLGGYDQSRVIEKPATFQNSTLNLTDISIGTSSGVSPIPTANLTNLLQSPLKVIPDGGVPYIYLPSDVCNAIAGHLPVTFNPGLGLYTWNTHDPAFVLLTTTPSYLQFTFTDLNNTRALIKVPFCLLNLTLEAPLSPTPMAYFPCSPLAPTDGIWRLGRAFLQAAFTGQNWDSNSYFIAQAPGPNLAPPSVKTIQSTDYTITAMPFASSWESTWTGILEPMSSNSTTMTPTNNTSTTLTPSPSPASLPNSLRQSAIGFAVGLSVAGVLGILGVYLLWRRRQRRKCSVLESTPAHTNDSLKDIPPVMTSSDCLEDGRQMMTSGAAELLVEPGEMWVSPPEIFSDSAELPAEPVDAQSERLTTGLVGKGAKLNSPNPRS